MVDYMKCPFCLEDIIQGAKKCKHCGSMLSEMPSGGTTIIEAFASQYEILGELGRGGMSTVYKARQIALDRIVALKVVPKEFTHDKDFVTRLRREAQSSAKLAHPNIVTTYDVGELGGYPFITLEYLSGGTLSEHIHKYGKLSEDQIKKIIIPILEGLSYSHAKGVVHRDIKSSNIMFNEHQHPILMDFGIARSTEGTKLTKTGTTIGTPEYMSPEQAMGKDTDLRSDLYSIGVVMYEMATCNVPFRSETGFGVIHKVVNEEPDMKLLQSNFSASLISIIGKLLAKSPGKRFQNSQDVNVALQQKQVVQIITLKPIEKDSHPVLPPIQAKPIPIPSTHPQKPYQGQETAAIQGNQSCPWKEQEETPLYDPDIEKMKQSHAKRNQSLAIIICIIVVIAIIWMAAANGNKHKPVETDVDSTMTPLMDTTAVAFDQTTYKASVQSTQTTQSTKQSALVEMVYVSGGSFTMGDTFGDGSNDEKPTHTVSLSSFYIGKYEVTQSQWRQVMGRNPPQFQGDSKPVEGVCWYDAIEFCNKLSLREGLIPCYSINEANTTCDWGANGYRLPTEAEWEYAAKGGNSSNGYKYSGGNDLGSVAWYGDNSNSKTHNVGSKQSNELGICDMSGSVKEWCWDIYDNGYHRSSPSSNPVGPPYGEDRSMRGGDWGSSDQDCRVSLRYYLSPNTLWSTVDIFGFRLAKTIK